MFRTKVLYIFICIALVAISVLAYKQVNIRIVETKADFERYTLSEIENISKIIIKGSLGGKANKLSWMEKMGNRYIGKLLRKL